MFEPSNLRPIAGQKPSEGKGREGEAPAFAGGFLLLELVDEIVLTPGDMRGQIHAELSGELIARAKLTKRSDPACVPRECLVYLLRASANALCELKPPSISMISTI
ncbi:hypothetical protein [Labrys neptuniae]